MIEYSHGRWGMYVLLRCRGSVIPKSMLWSLPCALATVMMHLYWGEEKGDVNRELEGIEQIWSGYTFVLGFLIVFRSNQAYSRFWESVTLFYTSSGEWLSAFSNLMCFCSRDEAKQAEVEQFRQYVMRLLSLLHCTALQGMCELRDDSMEVIDLGGINKDSLRHLQDSPDRCETVLLWIERLVMEADRDGILEASPPILSRAFQELSRGMVGVTNLKKIRDVPFPFPYTQYLSCMLIAHWLLTPVIASQMVLHPWWAACVVFVVSTSYWTLFYIAQEIDQPFGEDPNDLPVVQMQSDFNHKLKHMCHPLSYTVPDFATEADVRVTRLSSRLSVFGLKRMTPLEEDSVPALASSAPGSELPLPLALQQLKQVAQVADIEEVDQLLLDVDAWARAADPVWEVQLPARPSAESGSFAPEACEAPKRVCTDEDIGRRLSSALAFTAASPRKIARALDTALRDADNRGMPRAVQQQMQLVSQRLAAMVICEDSV